MEHICQICNEPYGDIVYTVQLKDERNNVTFTGHEKCVDEVFKIVKEECAKLNLKQTLAKLNLEVK